MYLGSAALGTALELGLFWQLAKLPQKVNEISKNYGIPNDRCKSWLDLLVEFELLEHQEDRYIPSKVANNAILETYSQETWEFMAQEIREQYQIILDLPANITHPNSVWDAQGITLRNYVAQMKANPMRADQFTRMLFELHTPLANKLANNLDLTGVNRLMDLGGGSGVVALALLEQYENLEAVVVDIENVCVTGRKIASDTKVSDRISYFAADFLKDEILKGFDMILECDVGVYGEDLFRKLWASLNENGSLIIVTNTNEQGAWLDNNNLNPNLLRLLNAFFSELGRSERGISEISELKILLQKSGFHDVKERILDNGIAIIQGGKKSIKVL
jgi:predicted O-methyltransferase YrrM